MHFSTRPALIVATLALGGLFPVAGVLARQAHAEWPPAPPAPPAPPEAPAPPAVSVPPAPPEPPRMADDIAANMGDSHREALKAIREARREVERERSLPADVRVRVLAELDAALVRVERGFRRRSD
jgi:hypothetical protein